MAKFVPLSEAAQILGISEDKLKDMREAGDIHAYRDGAGWKFKNEEVDRVSAALKSGDLGSGLGLDEELDLDETGGAGDADSILLSEVELGEEAGGQRSSTIIGKGEDLGEDSDVQLASESIIGAGGEADVELAGGSSKKMSAAGETGEGSGAQFDDLDDLDLDLESASDKLDLGVDGATGGSELSLGQSDLSLADDDSVKAGGDSAVSLADDEDEMVLGEGSDSDITLGSGDSGIQLIDPADSGLSLDEEPLDLAGSAVETLELGEDDEITLEEDADDEAATQLKADDDFLLTPLEETGGEETEDSGSQVIALDSESFDESADTLLGAGVMAGDAALADELGDAGAVSLGGPAASHALGPAPAAAAEAPYTVWNVMSLVLCVLMLSLTGMMLFDLIRNMWSWNEAYALNSTIMDELLQAIPIFKK
jgi:excisionase family DNA binding protein